MPEDVVVNKAILYRSPTTNPVIVSEGVPARVLKVTELVADSIVSVGPVPQIIPLRVNGLPFVNIKPVTLTEL
jgi:hypothetical protein